MWSLFFVVLALLLFFSWLNENPQALLPFWLTIGLIALFIYWIRKTRNQNRIDAMLDMATQLERLIENWQPAQVSILLRDGEHAIHEREEVELREAKGNGARIETGVIGATVGVTDNLGITLGKGSGQLSVNPETIQTIDTGKATFTDQRIIFTGSQQTRVWELNDLTAIEPGVNGFDVALHSSKRDKVAILAGDSKTGITPGILAQMAYELKSAGRDAATAAARKFIADIRQANTQPKK